LLKVAISFSSVQQMDATKENFHFYVYVEAVRGVAVKDVFEHLCTVFGESAPSQASVYRWYKQYSTGERNSIHRLPNPGRPISQRTDQNISRVFDFVEAEPKSTISCISGSLDLSKSTVLRILVDDLLFRKVCSVWIPHRLSDSNKAQRVACAQGLLTLFDSYSNYELLRIFATQDETWVPYDLVTCKEDNKVWIAPQTPRPTVVRPQLTFRKTMLSVVFTGNGKVSADVTERGETVDSERYIAFVHKTGELWRKLRSDSTCLKELLWMHDNARPHTATITREFFEKRRVELVQQSPYSPDLNMCDRWLFKEIKKGLRGYTLNCAKDVLRSALEVFNKIPIDRFARELETLKTHCNHVIALHGDYVTK
jgi:histone-lysine N-methyltransferase SETMAR